jgi:tetratricopeptide (TPR) repeat protein
MGYQVQPIKAFVGHSFRDEDYAVVDPFLKYFESLTELHQAFEWTHAQKAIPTEISTKVKELMEECNLFIGIFTRDKLRVYANEVGPCMFSRNKKVIDLREVKFCPSDWLIQESGYALGKGLKCIFLIEKDVIFDAGLQGDIEYIEFSRERIEDCHSKINQMLGSLSPSKLYLKEGLGRGEALSIIQSSFTTEEEASEGQTAFPHILLETSELADSGADIIKLKLLIESKIPITTELDQEDKAPTYRAMCYKLLADRGYDGAVHELEKMYESNPREPFPRIMIARFHQNNDDLAKAAEVFLSCVRGDISHKENISCIAFAAECYALNGKADEGYKILLDYMYGIESSDREAFYEAFKGLSLIAKTHGSIGTYAAFCEKALACNPSDHELRFDLAYKLQEINHAKLALHHYMVLQKKKPSGMVFNNQGVAFQSLGLKYHSVDSYGEAFKNYNETLAAANSAFLLLDSGFTKEADSLIEAAKKFEQYHQNIDEVKVKIHRLVKEEDARLEGELKSVSDEIKFLLAFAEAYTSNTSADFSGHWRSMRGDFQLETKGTLLTGIKEVEAPESQSAISGIFALGQIKSTRKITTTYEGKITNRSVEYKISVKSHPTSLLTNETTLINGIMYMDNDGSNYLSMEWTSGGKPTFYKAIRLR